MSDPNHPTPGDSDPVNNPAGDGVNITEDAVAQGKTGTRTFLILVVSLVLVVLVLFGLFGMHAPRSADTSATDKATAAQVGTTTPQTGS
ncbi:hypothetical protein BH09PSE2_BH09PSE2_18710 [soil metagenome]